MSLSRPKSWIAFLAGVGLGCLFFLPLAVAGLAWEKIPLFLGGLAGAGVFWLVAAFMAMYFVTGLIDGRYRDLRPAPWRDQVW